MVVERENSMALEWQELAPILRQKRLIPKAEVRDLLLSHEDPESLLSHTEKIGLKAGVLNRELYDKLESIYSSEKQNASQIISESTDDQIGRTIAPVLERMPEDVEFRNNLPDWSVYDFPDMANGVEVDINVHFDITGNSVTEGKMSDINSCFSSRLEQLRKLIVTNSNIPRRPQEIGQLLREKNRYKGYENIAVAVGLVNEPRYTKNGHLMFGVEDETGELANCLLTKPKGDGYDKEHAQVIEAGLMPDDVIGISGTFSNDGNLFYVSDLHFPMQPKHQKKSSPYGVSVAFLSDIHVGSKTFLEAQWHKMMRWFNQDPLAKTIKYLILSGDCVDGVGIYPGQDKELSIPDLFNQYTEFARLLELLPEWVECVMLPGNHDAVRPAEPQPTFAKDIQSDYNSTTFVGNPCDFSLHGVRLLSYHGKSIDDFVAGLKTVTYSEPVEAMRNMLRRRHLAPQWGGKTPLSPEPEDGLVIREVPDIFVTGHVHGHECIDFKGTTLVCSSTWQDQTSYQRMLGFQPKPCMLTVINLQTHVSTSIPFA